MRSSTIVERLTTVLETLDPSVTPKREPEALVRQLAASLVAPTPAEIWLLLAVLKAELPVRDDVVDAVRAVRLDGVAAFLSQTLRRTPAQRALDLVTPPKTVVVARNAVLVDVHHTARTGLATGIQRVVRNTIAQWNTTHTIELIVWDVAMLSFRAVNNDLHTNALYGTIPNAKLGADAQVVVPWQSLYVLPELAIEDSRSARLAAFTEFSGNTTTMIGHDCVPFTTAETAHGGISGQFPRTLVAVANMDRVATVSRASETEFRGWRTMLEGKPGPDIRAIGLPAAAGSVDAAALARAKAELVTPGKPLVVCVGSHEPRKNHLAVLQAADLVWRSGVDFSLVFVGGNAWNSEEFQQRLVTLQEEGRSVRSQSSITDELLWSAYRLARCTVFPSLNEGFGLPVAESLAAGTPVITSDFGSMRDIAAQGGALLVNPRDDADIADALRRLITDDALHAQLSAEALDRTNRTWEDYAAELWQYFAEQPDTSVATV